MEENAKTEQFLEMDEEQMQAITGAGLPEPSFKTSPITANLRMADKLFERANQAHQRGFTGLAKTITENGMKHLKIANQFEAEKIEGKKPILESSPSPSPNVGTSLRING
jgi:hypothetical protein